MTCNTYGLPHRFAAILRLRTTNSKFKLRKSQADSEFHGRAGRLRLLADGLVCQCRSLKEACRLPQIDSPWDDRGVPKAQPFARHWLFEVGRQITCAEGHGAEHHSGRRWATHPRCCIRAWNVRNGRYERLDQRGSARRSQQGCPFCELKGVQKHGGRCTSLRSGRWHLRCSSHCCRWCIGGWRLCCCHALSPSNTYLGDCNSPSLWCEKHAKLHRRWCFG